VRVGNILLIVRGFFGRSSSVRITNSCSSYYFLVLSWETRECLLSSSILIPSCSIRLLASSIELWLFVISSYFDNLSIGILIDSLILSLSLKH